MSITKIAAEISNSEKLELYKLISERYQVMREERIGMIEELKEKLDKLRLLAIKSMYQKFKQK